MDKNERKDSEKKFREGEFVFPFGSCEKMAKMMRRLCAGESGMVDCCSMMRKMMGHGEGKQATKKTEQTEEKKP